jgi:signal transduction histidine kinase
MTVTQSEGQIILSVLDEGIGIPPEDLRHLFEPFHRAKNVRAISGTGLGLAIVKEAVELRGGSITVDSALNVGTTFTIRLPDTL